MPFPGFLTEYHKAKDCPPRSWGEGRCSRQAGRRTITADPSELPRPPEGAEQSERPKYDIVEAAGKECDGRLQDDDRELHREGLGILHAMVEWRLQLHKSGRGTSDVDKDMAMLKEKLSGI